MSYKRTFGDPETFASANASYARAKQAVDSNMSNLLDFLRNTPVADLAANAFTGRMTAGQVEKIKQDAALDVQRASGGKISQDEARRVVEAEIDASIAQNGGMAESRERLALGALMGVAAVAGGLIWLTERRR
jgi:ApbE superfamily uncharacterized protein (UPF0280 family)